MISETGTRSGATSGDSQVVFEYVLLACNMLLGVQESEWLLAVRASTGNYTDFIACPL